MNSRYLDLVNDKHDAFGTPLFEEKAAACSRGLKEEYNRFVHNSRTRLANLLRGSKLWWKFTRNLMDKRSKLCSIPALRSLDGTWI